MSTMTKLASERQSYFSIADGAAAYTCGGDPEGSGVTSFANPSGSRTWQAESRHPSANARAIGLDAFARNLKELADVGPVAAGVPNRTGSRPTLLLDLERLEQMGYVVPGGHRTQLAAQFGEIKRPLLTNARSERALAERLALIMVTSAMPREGKTFCAVNLAISMSLEIDTSVLLVDADVNRPSILQRFAAQDQPGLLARDHPGLLDCVTDPRFDVSDLVLNTNVPKLSILPPGAPRSLSSELLASDAMDELLLNLIKADPNRVVVFDAPPLLVTTEAKILAARVGQLVMVVAASHTPRRALVEAFSKVEHCPTVMSVINKAPPPSVPVGCGY